MIHFEGIELCSCEKSFDWAITKLGRNQDVWGDMDRINKNVFGIAECSDGYRITLKCPACDKKMFVFMSKEN